MGGGWRGRRAVNRVAEMRSARIVVLVSLTWLGATGVSVAQSITTEAAMTGGLSSDGVSAVATQLRAFGDADFGIRYFAEAAWARNGSDADAFGAAYPYSGRLQAI